MQKSTRLAIALLVTAAGALSLTNLNLRAEPATQPAPDDILYDDPAAHSSATITQVLPNSSTTLLTLENVRRIRIKQEVLIIEWGATATTLLPRQFISSISINKRTPITPPTTVPAH